MSLSLSPPQPQPQPQPQSVPPSSSSLSRRVDDLLLRLEDLHFPSRFVDEFPALVAAPLESSNLIQHWIELTTEIEILSELPLNRLSEQPRIEVEFLSHLLCVFGFPLADLNSEEARLAVEEFLVGLLQAERMIATKIIRKENNKMEQEPNSNEKCKMEDEEEEEEKQTKTPTESDSSLSSSSSVSFFFSDSLLAESHEFNFSLNEAINELCELLAIPLNDSHSDHSHSHSQSLSSPPPSQSTALSACVSVVSSLSGLHHSRVSGSYFSLSAFDSTSLAVLLDIHSYLIGDFSRRRAMLIQRFLVTQQQFIWTNAESAHARANANASSSANSKESEIRLSIKKHQANWKSSSQVQFATLFGLTTPMIEQFWNAKAAASRTANKLFRQANAKQINSNDDFNRLRRLLTGKMPDRGGRIGDSAPPNARNYFPAQSRGQNFRSRGGGQKRLNEENRENKQSKADAADAHDQADSVMTKGRKTRVNETKGKNNRGK